MVPRSNKIVTDTATDKAWILRKILADKLSNNERFSFKSGYKVKAKDNPFEFHSDLQQPC